MSIPLYLIVQLWNAIFKETQHISFANFTNIRISNKNVWKII